MGSFDTVGTVTIEESQEVVGGCVVCNAIEDFFDRPKISCQSPKSGTNKSRTSGSIRCTRDMESTWKSVESYNVEEWVIY
jgi:dissimilatory sulfite reductase (desulfoviridin) alpha/beta subunit